MWVRMSKTISFVASDELAEFLEREAEERMTTVSSTAQMLLAEKVRETQAGEGSAEAGKSGSELDPLDRPPFTENPGAWYEPDTQDPDEIVAVRIPDSAHVSEDRRYYKTYPGAAKAIKRWYE